MESGKTNTTLLSFTNTNTNDLKSTTVVITNAHTLHESIGIIFATSIFFTFLPASFAASIVTEARPTKVAALCMAI